MTLRERFTKETGLTDGIMFVHAFGFRDEYVLWLESQIPIREQAAWDAARTVGFIALVTGKMSSCISVPESAKYQSIEKWRKQG